MGGVPKFDSYLLSKVIQFLAFAKTLSNGLDEISGCSLNFVASARALQNPAIDKGLMQVSTPPATITSAASI